MTDNKRKILWGIFLLAVLFRLSAILYLDSYSNPVSYDSQIIAENVVQGAGFVFPFAYFCSPAPTSYKSPLYVYFLASLFLFGRNPVIFLTIQIIQACLGGLTCLILVKICDTVKLPQVGIMTGVLYAIYPSAVVIATRMHEINFTVILLACLILALCRFRFIFSRNQAVLTGISMGITLLAEPSLGFFCGVASFGYLIFIPAEFRERIRKVALMAVCAGAVMSPWLIRNYLVHHEFVMVKANIGLNLWIGNNPHATGSGRALIAGDEGPEYVFMSKTMDPALKEKVRSSPSEIRRDKILLNAALSYIRENPWLSIKSALRKITFMWWRHPIHPLGQKKIYQIPQLLLFLTGLAGLAFAWRDNRYLVPLLITLFLCQTCVYMVFFVLPRYRLVLDPFLIIGVAFLLVRVAKWFTSTISRPSLGANII